MGSFIEESKWHKFMININLLFKYYYYYCATKNLGSWDKLLRIYRKWRPVRVYGLRHVACGMECLERAWLFVPFFVMFWGVFSVVLSIALAFGVHLATLGYRICALCFVLTFCCFSAGCCSVPQKIFPAVGCLVSEHAINLTSAPG